MTTPLALPTPSRLQLETEVDAAVRQAKREANYRYRTLNRESYLATQARYRKRHRKRLNAAARDYRQICAEKFKASQAKWVAKNPDYSRKRRAANPEHWRKGGKYFVPYAQRVGRHGPRGNGVVQVAVSQVRP